MVGILVLSGLGAVAIEQTEKENIILEKIKISSPKLIEKEGFISIGLSEANSNYWDEDKPFIPVVSKVYTFEFGTKIDNVEVTYSNIKTQKLSKLIEPTPKSYIRSMAYKTTSIKKPSEISYSGLGIYPQKQFSYRTAAGKEGKDNVIVCAVSLYPIQYNTLDNTISYAQNADIKIKYTPPTSTIIFPDVYDLLILTTTEFETTLQRFVDHKEGRNIRTKLVTLDEIYPTGADIQESIKFFIKDAIETWGVDYLILVGSGVKDNEKFPVRYINIDNEDYPSDLYFADIYNSSMGFADWDVDEDGDYGEYPRDRQDMDLLPDIYLGKIPCNTTGELNNYIDKVIWYDKHNLMTKKIVLIGGDTIATPADEVFEGEFANQAVLDVLTGYTGIKNWASTGKLTKQNIAAAYKKVLPDFIDFSGHGSTKSWATHPPNNENKWIPNPTLIAPWSGWHILDFDANSIKNAKKYPIVMYHACLNNEYTESDSCLSWTTLKRPNGGGIIAFGATALSRGSQGEAAIERFFGWLEVRTHEELFNTKNLGQVWANSIKGYCTNFEGRLQQSDFKTITEYSMFGDPTLNAENGDDPKVRSQPDIYFNRFKGLLNYFPRIAMLFELLLTKIS